LWKRYHDPTIGQGLIRVNFTIYSRWLHASAVRKLERKRDRGGVPRVIGGNVGNEKMFRQKSQSCLAKCGKRA
jgi:hypothetical protein